jgi:polyhydroxyalkanoate synthesis regulator phasin
MNMSERTELLKKAVMASVGASTSVDRIKTALDDAMRDLFKVGQGLMDDLEEEGKVRAEYVQDFLKDFQAEATKRTAHMEKTVSTKVQTEMKKAAREIGLITQEDWEELCERLSDIEEALGIPSSEEGEGGNGENPGQKRRGKRKKS